MGMHCVQVCTYMLSAQMSSFHVAFRRSYCPVWMSFSRLSGWSQLCCWTMWRMFSSNSLRWFLRLELYLKRLVPLLSCVEFASTVAEELHSYDDLDISIFAIPAAPDISARRDHLDDVWWQKVGISPSPCPPAHVHPRRSLEGVPTCPGGLVWKGTGHYVDSTLS